MRKVFKNTEHQLQFEQQGYIIVNLLDENEVDALNDVFKQVEPHLVQMPFATSTMAMNADTKCLVSDAIEKAFKYTIEMLFDNYRWFFGSFIYKYPSSKENQGEVSMHQDASIVDESQFHGINIFCSLGVANQSSGALQIIPGSHLLNPNPRGFGQPFPYEHHKEQLFSKLKRVDLNPGQAIIYTTKLFHYSKPNQSNSPRVIAAGIVGPKESELLYYHVDRDKPKTLEVYEVDSDYYLKAPFFSRPSKDKYSLKEEIPVSWKTLTKEDIDHYQNQLV